MVNIHIYILYALCSTFTCIYFLQNIAMCELSFPFSNQQKKDTNIKIHHGIVKCSLVCFPIPEHYQMTVTSFLAVMYYMMSDLY